MGERLEMMSPVRDSENNPERRCLPELRQLYVTVKSLGTDLTFSKMWQNFSNLILTMNIFSKLALRLGRFEV